MVFLLSFFLFLCSCTTVYPQRTIGFTSTSSKTLYLYSVNFGEWDNPTGLTSVLDSAITLTPQTPATLVPNEPVATFNVPDYWYGFIFAVDKILKTGIRDAACIYPTFPSASAVGPYMTYSIFYVGTPQQGFTITPTNTGTPVRGADPTQRCNKITYEPPSTTKAYIAQFCDPAEISFIVNFTD